MFGFKNIAFASAAIFLAAPAAIAQTPPAPQFTPDQIRACMGSVMMPDYPAATGSITYDVSNTTTFSTRFLYDYSLCQGISVASVTLTDVNGGNVVKCTYEQFSTVGAFKSVCAGATYSTMAQTALNAGPDGADFYTDMRLGVRPTFYTRQDIFTVYGADARTTMITSTSATATSPASTTAAATITPPATVSEMSRRRRRAMETGEIVLSSAMICDAGKTACPMRDRKHWFTKCIDTTAELYACGGCPGSEGAQDCSELKGAADVECVRGTCQINQCARSHKLSTDGKTCVPKEAYQKRSFW